ncbi:tyrosine-type recombinase/integrase [Aphanothece stagnina]|uniref:tyrosine-type recombinase/integrase n=1 Tax=Aphanothece stagnina TaxID=1004305 RepID=UPI00398EEA2A
MMTVDKRQPEEGLLLPILGGVGGGVARYQGRKTPQEATADYFGAKIANDNTRAAYLRDAKEFAAWCMEQGLPLEHVETLHVARFRDHLRTAGNSAATIKRKMSSLRNLFAYMVETGSLGFNPAREVSTEKVRVKGGKTPALDAQQMRMLFESFDPSRPIELRDRALIAVMAYALARVSAAVAIRAEDFIDLGRTQMIRLHEKGGVQRDIPAHPRLVEYLDAWLAVAALRTSDWLFPAFDARGTIQSSRPMSRGDALRMVKRRLLRAGIPPVFSNHSFRATGITEFLANGGSLEIAQQLANHADSRTTKLYDRRATRLELEEIVRIRY